jgi:hypothetical protein
MITIIYFWTPVLACAPSDFARDAGGRYVEELKTKMEEERTRVEAQMRKLELDLRNERRVRHRYFLQSKAWQQPRLHALISLICWGMNSTTSVAARGSLHASNMNRKAKQTSPRREKTSGLDSRNLDEGPSHHTISLRRAATRQIHAHGVNFQLQSWSQTIEYEVTAEGGRHVPLN